jgi:hypothetical protein
MARVCFAALLITFVPMLSAAAQVDTDAQRGEQEERRKAQRLLDEIQIDSADFRDAMPLEKFLAVLEQRLPKGGKLALSIDPEAFGERREAVAGAMVSLPAPLKKITLRAALERAIAKSKVQADYRLHAAQVTITTPELARYSAVYDIRALVGKPRLGGRLSTDVPALGADATQIVQALVAALPPFRAAPAPGERDAIEILNGNRLVIRASASEHAQVEELLQAFRRLGDVAVTVTTRLYEVDDAFYRKLTNAKRTPWEELERQFLAGRPLKDDMTDLFGLLPKQVRIQAGDAIPADNGQEVSLLSRQRAVLCLGSPEQAIRGDRGSQVVLEGVALRGRITVSPDRRYVRLRLIETSASIVEFEKVKVPAIKMRLLGARIGAPDRDGPDDDVQAEVPVVKEAVHSETLEIPDGGSILVPVHYRATALAQKGRWWAMTITPRIVIEEEERAILDQRLAVILPAVVDDILTNPRLQATRDFVGTSGDSRFALINSPTWTWPKASQPVAGFQRTQAERAGKRLLGIRVDNASITGGPITMGLVNAGGTANGAVFGSTTVRYNARETEKGVVVELRDTQGP